VLHLKFTALASQTYTVQFAQTLSAKTWTKLTDVPGQSSTQVVEVTDPLSSGGTRFYRVVTPAQP
jgi:hypothetical protein